MADDIVEQLRWTNLTLAEMLRAMGEAGNEILRLRARAVEERQRVRHEVADEIERLRAERDELQALIDAAAPLLACFGDGASIPAADCRIVDALLAAATKEDDRG